MRAVFQALASPTPSMCTWHHCTPYSPEPKWSVNPPNVLTRPEQRFCPRVGVRSRQVDAGYSYQSCVTRRRHA
jgi:hypothetical protein